MVIVGEGAAGEAQGLVAHFGEERNGRGRIGDGVRVRGVRRVVAGVDGGGGLGSVLCNVDCGRWRGSSQSRVFQVKGWLGGSASVLSPEAVRVRFIRHAQRGE